MAAPYCIISWNVNGYSDAIHQLVHQLVTNNTVDILFLSETKRKEEVLKAYFNTLTDYNFVINAHNPATYHGVAFLVKKTIPFSHLVSSLQCPVRSDSKSSDPATGRVISLYINNSWVLVGTYTPNSGTTASTRAKNYDYRVKTWDPAFHSMINAFRQQVPVMVVGDINVALQDIDVSDPSKMKTWAGFTQAERDNLALMLNDGWIDVWRLQHPSDRVYTWLGSGTGMRLDNVLVSASLLTRVNTAFIMSGFVGSDHTPIGVYVHS